MFYDWGQYEVSSKIIHDTAVNEKGIAWCMVLESEGLSDLYHGFAGQVHGAAVTKAFNRDVD